MIGLWIGKTGEANAWYHITLTAMAEKCEFLHVVRHRKPSREITSERIQYHCFSPGEGALSFFSLFTKGFSVLKKHHVDFIITFNLFPYGIISSLLARLFHKKLILSFIGADFNTYFYKKIPRLLIKSALNRSNVVICKGHHMTEGLLAAGVREEKLSYYPHFLADDFNPQPNFGVYRYDLITVCELIKRKNVNILLDAVSILKREGVKVKVCIVGSGSESLNLKQKANDLGIANQIDFIGYTESVLQYLLDSKIYVQTSRGEGLSLALLESLGAGLIPITTNAGSENDFLVDGEHALFVRINDARHVAEKAKLLLLNQSLFKRMKKNVLDLRTLFSMEHATKHMSAILAKLEDG